MIYRASVTLCRLGDPLGFKTPPPITRRDRTRTAAGALQLHERTNTEGVTPTVPAERRYGRRPGIEQTIRWRSARGDACRSRRRRWRNRPTRSGGRQGG